MGCKHPRKGSLGRYFALNVTDIGDPAIPVQPTRIPVQLVKEISSQLNALGIELLSKEFVIGTLKACREAVGSVYNEIVSEGEISSDAALQLLTDVMFLEIGLASGKEFAPVKDKLIEKVDRKSV